MPHKSGRPIDGKKETILMSYGKAKPMKNTKKK